MDHMSSRRKFLKLMAGLLGGLVSGRMAGRAGTRIKASGSGCLDLISVRPERSHLVSPGSVTTFVVAVTNSDSTQATVNLSVRAQSDGWTARVSEADSLFRAVSAATQELTFDLEGAEKRYFVIEFGPGQDEVPGQTGVAEVRVTIAGRPSDHITVRAKVHTSPKIYFMVYDGLGREYLKLDRRGEHDDVMTDPLMPNLRSFVADSAYLPKARAHAPSFTDPNHVSVLTGSWPGTSGAISINYYYCGLDDEGNPVTVAANSDILRWGSGGEPVRSIFDAAKDPAMGGDPDALNAMILGKDWIGSYFEDEQGTVDIIATGHTYPEYIPAPEPYVLGDPRSDNNADQDRDGWNLKPPEHFRKVPNPPTGTSGNYPDKTPEDRWIVAGALRMIAAEDPDVLYILPGNLDYAQHHTGAADRPEEWGHGSHPEVLWDDFNGLNLHANRDPVLDVAHEADAVFGLLVRTLRARGTYDDSIVVLTSDHGQCTYMDEFLSVTEITGNAGIPEEAFEFICSVAEVAFLWLSDPSYADGIESALEDFSIHHPVLEQEVHPFLVLNREEMDTGVDHVVGRVAADGGPGHGELYSKWYIDHPVDDNSKPVWPDLIVFSRQRFQMEYSKPWRPFVGSHGGVGWQQDIPLAIRGPAIRKGVFGQRAAFLADIVPTLYYLLGWETPAHVDGRVLSEILSGG